MRRLVLFIPILGLLAGCQPPPGAVVERQPEPLPAVATEGPIAPGDWSPSVGRMDANLSARHLPSDLRPQLLWSERFTDATPQGLPNWRAIGRPTLKLVRLAGSNGVEFGSSGGPAGYERALDTGVLAGKDVRLELRFACPSMKRVAALKGISISVLATGRGRTTAVKLPLVADVSPGWETQSWCMHFRPDIRAASVKLEAGGPDALLTCSRLAIYSETWGSALAGQSPAPGAADNLIVDGDFETGQPRFSVSAVTRWPDGSELTLPVYWRYIDDKAAGRQALEVGATGKATRVLFGPLDLAQARRPTTQPEADRPYRLSFYARCARPAALTATLRTVAGVIGQATFQPTEKWNWYSADLLRRSDAPAGADARWAELLLDVVTADSDVEPNAIALDAIRLARSQPPTTSAPVCPQAFDLGLIAGDGAENIDLRNLFDIRDGLIFTARVVGAPKSPPPGQLALDLLDSQDRVVWTRTVSPKLDANGVYEEPVQLPMPRGYYRALATLWSGQPGQSEYHGHTSLSMAVIALDDPVPIGGPFGLSLVGGTVSLRSTQLGAAWAHAELPASRVQRGGQLDLTLWHWLLGRAAQADVDAVASVTLPQSPAMLEQFLAGCLGTRDALPAALVLSSPAASDLKAVHDAIRSRGLEVRIVCDSSGNGDEVRGNDPDVLGISAPAADLPEMSEAALERAAHLKSRAAGKHAVWDVHVPVRLSDSPDTTIPAGAAESAAPVYRIPTQIEPLRAASRMVRAALIRSLAGTQRVALDAVALAPLRTTLQPDERRLHGPDQSPRVAAAAFDAMTGLLNDAALKRWIDLPGGGRVLYFEKDDGRAVAALWRPFGMAPTRVVFEQLPEGIEQLDVTGAGESVEMLGTRRQVEVNEIVRYLVAPADLRQTLRAALDKLQVLPGSQ